MDESERKSGRGWIWTASLGLIVLALGNHFYRIIVDSKPWFQLPMASLEVADGLAERTRVPAMPADLRGHNLLLVTLDTTRPDRLGCYGNDEIETPHLDQLAASGLLFSNAVATSSATLPTHASIMTGLYPHHHQARVNFKHAVSDDTLTLAEILSASGYRTGAFVSSVVLKAKYGLAQGFDRYDLGQPSQHRMLGNQERAADQTTDAAISWLKQQHGHPFFAWVHYYDAHAPYAPPEEFAGRYANDYDAELAHVDQQLGRLLEFIDEEASGETIVVVVGDHGEAMGEHGEQAHGMLVQEATIRIPLVIYASSGLERGVHIPTRVSQVDLLPTIVSLLGLPVPVDLDGVDLTGTTNPERALLAESVYGHFVYGWAPIAAIYRGVAKYVDGPQPELYDLDDDPLEAKDLHEERPVQVQELSILLRALRGPDADRLPDAQVALVPEEVEQLRALGYVDGGAGPGAKNSSAPSPQAMLPLLNELHLILTAPDSYERLTTPERVLLRLIGRPVISDVAMLAEELEDFARAHPEFAPTYEFLEETYRRLGREEAAVRAHERLVELRTQTGEGE